MKTAVTGGSGVVGATVVRHLVEAGHQVVALARSAYSAGKLHDLGASPMSGDVLDPPSLRHLVEGADWVFHVAGVNEMCSRHPDHMDLVNIEGIRNVIRASQEDGEADPRFPQRAAALCGRDQRVDRRHRRLRPGSYSRSRGRGRCSGAGGQVGGPPAQGVPGDGQGAASGPCLRRKRGHTGARSELHVTQDTIRRTVDWFEREGLLP